jgi:hypothetical protein
MFNVGSLVWVLGEDGRRIHLGTVVDYTSAGEARKWAPRGVVRVFKGGLVDVSKLQLASKKAGH